jgi:hypothetical protein
VSPRSSCRPRRTSQVPGGSSTAVRHAVSVPRRSRAAAARALDHSGLTISSEAELVRRRASRRDHPAGDRRADQNRARAGGPEAAVEPAQEREAGCPRPPQSRLPARSRLLAVDRRPTHCARPYALQPACGPRTGGCDSAQQVEIHPAKLFRFTRPYIGPPPAARLVAGIDAPAHISRTGSRPRAALATRARKDDGASTSTPGAVAQEVHHEFRLAAVGQLEDVAAVRLYRPTCFECQTSSATQRALSA